MSESDLIKLNSALNEFQTNKEVDDMIMVKSAGPKIVTYEVRSTDRDTTRTDVENALKKHRVGTVSRDLMAVSSMEVTNCKSNGMTYRFIYKPTHALHLRLALSLNKLRMLKIFITR
jgi:hypothetical protein